MRPWSGSGHELGAGLARLAGHAARDLAPAAIVVLDRGAGAALARLLSDERPRAPIVFCSDDADARGQLALFWGVRPRAAQSVEGALRLLERVAVDEARRPRPLPGEA